MNDSQKSVSCYVVELFVVFKGDQHLFCMINIFSFICLLNDNLLSGTSPRWLWSELILTSELLKKSSGYVISFFFVEKIISSVCLVRYGLNYIFHWYALLCFFNRSLLSVEAEVFMQFTMLDKEVSSAKSLTSEFSPSSRLFT